MPKINCKYIYGPVYSWRLGSSLGIDPISKKGKVCSFNCIYCQVGKTTSLTDKRKRFVAVRDIIRELDSLPKLRLDYISFSGAGEPTLAKNLKDMIKAVKKIRGEKIAVLTNSSLLTDKDVQKSLLIADLVAAKLDAPSQDIFEEINRPIKGTRLDSIIKAIKDFRKRYKGRLALQVMFTKYNRDCAKEIAETVRAIGPDEVQINTPLRPCRAKPLSKDQIDKIKRYFKGLNIISVYDKKKKRITPISRMQTLKRRGEA